MNEGRNAYYQTLLLKQPYLNILPSPCVCLGIRADTSPKGNLHQPPVAQVRPLPLAHDLAFGSQSVLRMAGAWN